LNIKWCVLFLWNLLDPIYYAFTRLKYLDGNADGKRDNIFRVRLMRYRGRPITLADGTTVRKGDVLVKIHLHNVRLMKKLFAVNSAIAKGRLIARFVSESLPGLADYVRNHPRGDRIRAVVGITMINRGCRQLGFEPFSPVSRLYKFYKRLTLLPIYWLAAERPMESFRKQAPTYLFMSKETLFEKYGVTYAVPEADAPPPEMYRNVLVGNASKGNMAAD